MYTLSGAKGNTNQNTHKQTKTKSIEIWTGELNQATTGACVSDLPPLPPSLPTVVLIAQVPASLRAGQVFLIDFSRPASYLQAGLTKVVTTWGGTSPPSRPPPGKHTADHTVRECICLSGEYHVSTAKEY